MRQLLGSSAFVADVFQALHYKLYQPCAVPPPAPARASLPPQNIAPPAAVSIGNGTQVAPTPPPSKGTRKRGYHESAGAEAQNVSGRVFKQPRRGAHGGRGARMENTNGPRGGGMMPSGFQTNLMHGRQAFVPPLAQNRTQFDGNFPLDAFMQQLQQQVAQFPLPLPEIPPIRQAKRPSRRRKNQLCRDFQTKGFCARPYCAVEHGLPADVLRRDGMCLPTTSALFHRFTSATTSGNAGLLWTMRGRANGSAVSAANFRIAEYDPRQALMALSDDGNQQSLPPHLLGFPVNGSALSFPHDTVSPLHQQHQKQRKGRAPFSADGPVNDRTKSTIVIENNPEEQFNEEQVRSFFSQFGNILEVSMQPYKRLAIVKFDNWGAANAAYRSPKVIFENRFVKVFWYKDDTTAASQSIPPGGKQPAGGSQPSANGSPMEGEPEIDIEKFTRKQEEAQKLHVERKQKQQEIDRQREELDRRHKELVAKQQEERQKLHARIKAAATAQGSDADPSSSPDITFGPNDGSSASDSKPDSQMEALRAQLAALEEEAKSLGLDPDAADDESSSWSSGFRGRGRGGYFRSRGFAPRGFRGGHRGRGGGGDTTTIAAYSLDNRPKKVAVTGVDFTAPETDEVLRQYLLVGGEGGGGGGEGGGGGGGGG